MNLLINSLQDKVHILKNYLSSSTNELCLTFNTKSKPAIKAGLLICVLHAIYGSTYSVGGIPRLKTFGHGSQGEKGKPKE